MKHWNSVILWAMRAPVALCVAAGMAAAAQEPSAPATFHATTELVQVNVVALDKHGKPVSDLKREEFQIFDTGVPQEIRLFTPQGERAAPQLPEVAATNTFTNRIPPPAGPQSGYTVILIDNLYSGSDPTNEEGSILSRSRALEMLRSAPPGEKIAIYAPGLKFKVICEFTTDRDLLKRELRKFKVMPSTPAGEPRPTLQSFLNPQAVEEIQSRVAQDMARVEALGKSDIGDFQLSALADHLAGVPGRKKMIWLANKFPIAPRALQNLNRAGVSIYPVDIDGVCRLCPPRPRVQMDMIAAATGGVPYYGRNDLSKAMLEAMDDGNVSYTLGFYPSTEDDRGAQVHRLAVSVSRAGIRLRYGNTYQRAALPVTVNPGDLGRAMSRPVDAIAIAVKASVTKVRDRLGLDAVVDAGGLGFALDGDRWTGRIEFAARFTTADAVVAGDPISRSLSFNLSQEKYDAAVRDGITYHHELQIPPKAVELKLLFANPASGKIGTLTIPLSRVKAGAGSSVGVAR